MENTSKKPTKSERLYNAWSELKSSFVLPAFGVSSIIATVFLIFDWHNKLKSFDWWPDNIATVFVIFYVFLALFVVRSVFLVAESCGKFRKLIEIKEKEIKAHFTVFESLHSVIHNVRDSMFANKAFLTLLQDEIDDEQRASYLFQIVEAQLGHIERAFRRLSDAEMCVTLKVVNEDWLVSAAYSPGTPIERRNESLNLPLNQGIASEALITKSISYSNNIKNDSRFWPKNNNNNYFAKYQTVVASPLIIDEDYCGVLCFDWKEPEKYQEKYNQIVAAFTDMLTSAFHIYYNSIYLSENKGDNNESEN